MRQYVRLQTAALLRHLAIQVDRTALAPEADDVHDLRVAIRRLSRCLRAFSQFYPGHSWKRIRRRLADLMDACGRVRDRDIAIALLEQAGVAPASPLVQRLDTGRRAAIRRLQRELRRWQRHGFAPRWQARLEL